MTLRGGLRAYFAGWRDFLVSTVYVALWPMIVGLPVVLLGLFLPDYMEGHARGSTVVQVAAVVVMLLWIPWVSHKLGALAFETDARPAKPGRQTDPEIELLRGIIATQERLAARDGGPDETT